MMGLLSYVSFQYVRDGHIDHVAFGSSKLPWVQWIGALAVLSLLQGSCYEFSNCKDEEVFKEKSENQALDSAERHCHLENLCL